MRETKSSVQLAQAIGTLHGLVPTVSMSFPLLLLQDDRQRWQDWREQTPPTEILFLSPLFLLTMANPEEQLVMVPALLRTPVLNPRR